jgi:hypothetical protein
MRLVLGPVLSLALLAGVGAAGAQAAQRYAAPGAAGVDCTVQEPCSFPDAVNGASANDEVIVMAGEYTISGAPLNVVYGGLQIHGDLAGPMPRVVAELGGWPAINMSAEGSSLSYIEVVNTETEAVGVRCMSASRVEGVRALGVGEGAAGLVQLGNCLVRDSLLRGEGTNSLGIESLAVNSGEPASTVRNVTAIAAGPNSVGIQSRYTGPSGGHHTLVLSNSIGGGGQFDLRAEDSANGPGVIAVSNSNFDSFSALGAASVSGAANQLAPPVFVDAAAADYREAAGSPTIDAGSTEGIGALDLAGNPRSLGAAPDIGAFEFVPLPPGAAGVLTALSVTPRSFSPRKSGGAIVSKSRGKGTAATVRYALTAAASVDFTVERALKGRKVGAKCRKQTAANRNRKRCTRYKPLKGGFSHQGGAGENSFGFSGRVGARALAPGKYRLVAVAGTSAKRAPFKVTR